AGALRASISEVTGEGEEYTVVFTINNRDVSSVWIREYGNWRIGTFGTIAAGDRALIDRRQAQRERDANLRLNSPLHLEAGYAFMFDTASAALFLNLDLSGSGFNFYHTGNIFSFGFYFGHRFSIRAGNFGFMPYFRAGLTVVWDDEWQRWQYEDDGRWSFQLEDYRRWYVPASGKIGLKVTSTHLPGFFGNIGFQLNWTFNDDVTYNLPGWFRRALTFSVGYAF
ncbi:MAG: hypothetical protein FWC97_06180, partial [Treponema sp.]|nr:hypothetical protein [Treponema sp.]